MIFRPDLLGQPVVVLSNNDGAIVSLTNEAKALGIEKFKPYFQQRHLIETHHVTVFSSNYVNYGHVSDRIMKTIAEHASIYEIYSIDEIFCDVTKVGNRVEFGHYIKNKVWRDHRIPMGVGIAPTKTLSKLANHAAKKITSLNGVCVADTQAKIDWLINRAGTTDIWGIGKGLKNRLEGHGIYRASELVTLPSKRARNIGGVVLERIVRELNGESCLAFETEIKPRKEIVCSRSFGTKTQSLSQIQSALSGHIIQVHTKLRKQQSCCGYVRVWLQTSRHVQANERYFNVSGSGLHCPTDNIRLLLGVAIKLLDEIFCDGYLFAKVGVSLSNLSDRSTCQQDMFSQVDKSKSDAINETLEMINHKLGKGTVTLARNDASDVLAANHQHLSPRYFTQWSEIPTVRC